MPILWCLFGHFGYLQFLENRLLDLRYRMRGEMASPLKIVYVDIDNEAIQAYRWPWNHSRYAQLIDALFVEGQVKAVGFDVLFSENSFADFGIEEQKEGRMQFGKSIHQHKNVVLAAAYVPGQGLLQEKRKFPWVFDGATDPAKNDTPELPAYPIMGPSWGTAGLIDTYKGVPRFAPIYADASIGSFYPMSLQLALIHWGVTVDSLVRYPDRMEVHNPDGSLLTSIPIQREQLVEVNWFSRWISPENPRCSVADIGQNLALLEDADPQNQKIGREFFDQFKDAIVLVGPVDPMLQDLAETPFDESPVPQVGFHGNLVKTFVSGNYIRHLPKCANHGLTFLLTIAVVALALMRRGDEIRYKFLALLLVLLYIGGACWLFTSNHLEVPLTAPLGSTVMTCVMAFGWQLVDEQRAKKKIKGMFGTYVSPELVEQMVKTGESPQLGGVEREITAYFSDIQAFSAFSELLPPDKLVELMNEYLTACTDIIFSQNGALDKYIGDAVVAMFGGLTTMEDHAYRACVTSQLVQIRLEELREKWRSEGDKWPEVVGSMRSRIGLNSGMVIVGNMGSPARFNFTMMGDNVNLAARMESGAKAYGVLSMVTESTYRDCVKYGGDHVVFRNLDKIVVKGRSEPVSIYEVVGLKDHVEDRTLECLALYAQGLALYQAMDWEGAQRYFLQSVDLEPNQFGGKSGSDINPSRIMISRCQQLAIHPPDAGWDGVYLMETK
ncbi:MAG: adenylate/guanylate cyclase domain-containing protein [Akkermansiaceae bacterium]|nr:adenylate/guanylate cyclase domain-containing protein [Akkermansiaceae bacterium]MDP4896464.1 adenylate/guanylate cyclase domain-containing protein [Akkermansiaceae bacterium]MDP4997009.1 adenylate/guanylate cyclase domain-containing protein [Akkermansiaceae bacterium]